jgi:uncharacterized protein (TIGR02231 family)
MRLALTVTASLAASAAVADEFLLRGEIRAATVYAGMAEVVRGAEVSLPGGTHRLMIAVPGAAGLSGLQVTTDADVTLGIPQALTSVPVGEGQLDTAEQAAARRAVEAAEDTLRRAQVEIEQLDAEVSAKLLQIDYLRSIAAGGDNGTAMPDDPNALATQLEALGTQMARLQVDVLNDSARRPDLEAVLELAQAELAAAEYRLRTLQPYVGTADVLAVDVTASSDTDLSLNIAHLLYGVGWQPAYDAALNTEAGTLSLARTIVLNLGVGEAWSDVEVTVSADNPDRPQGTVEPVPTPARIFEPEVMARSDDKRARDLESGLALQTPVMEESVVAGLAVAQGFGLALSYRLTQPVSSGGATSVAVPLDELAFEPELVNLAVPRTDRTAFLIAEIENDTGEPILPGEARFFRDGALIATGFLNLVPTGGRAELGFGPLDHIQLEWQNLSLDEGDRGFIRQSNTRTSRVRFSVENLSDSAEPVRILYATPFAEQEDLSVDVSLTPAADTTEWDDRRGVAAWEIDLDGRSTQDFAMEVDFRWPQGQVLRWQP